MDQFLTEIGKYKIESHLGRGAFGVVYKCKNKETNEIVAVKTLRKNTKTSQKLLKSEIEVLQSINCVNVVKMIESFTDRLPYDPQEYEFLVMEYCESNLLDYVYNKKNHYLEEKEALEIFAQVLNGFQSIHEKGIMHRDLKLENVLIKDGIVKIADFGLAKKMESTASNEHLTRSFCGTKAYLAPEILNGSYYDYKVDIWSLGVLLFVMLFFKFPFGSRQDNPLELLKRIKNCCEEDQFSVDSFIQKNFQNRINNKQNTEQDVKGKSIKTFQISDEVKDLFKRIFVVKPENRIGFEELLKHQALQKQKIQNMDQHLDFYGNKFPTLFKYQSQLVIKANDKNGNSQDDYMNKEEMDINEENEFERQTRKNDQQHKEITTGQMSSIMMACRSTIRYNMKNSSQFRKHIMIYNHLICRYQMLIIAYQQIQQGWLIDLLGQKDYTVLKYFLLKGTIYYIQNLKKYLEDADNSFSLKEWPSFVNSKPFKNILSQVTQDCKKWLPEYHLLSEEVQDYEYDSEDIKKGVYELIPTDVDIDIYINGLPSDLKLPFRGVVLTVFSKVYEYAGKCFSKMEEYEQQNKKLKEQQQKQSSSSSPNQSPSSRSKTRYSSPFSVQNSTISKQQQQIQNISSNKFSNFIKQNNNTKQTQNQQNNSINNKSSNNSNNNSNIFSTQSNSIISNQSNMNNSLYSQKLLVLKINFEEQFGIKSIRMALLLISCGVINRIFEVPSCIIRLKEFQPLETNQDSQNQQQTFRFEELVEWFYQVSKDKAYKQIDLIVNSYFKQISAQLCSKKSQQEGQKQEQVPTLNKNNSNGIINKNSQINNIQANTPKNNNNQKLIKPA